MGFEPGFPRSQEREDQMETPTGKPHELRGPSLRLMKIHQIQNVHHFKGELCIFVFYECFLVHTLFLLYVPLTRYFLHLFFFQPPAFYPPSPNLFYIVSNSVAAILD